MFYRSRCWGGALGLMKRLKYHVWRPFPFLLWFGSAFSYCETLENAAAPIKHFVIVRNGASVANNKVCLHLVWLYKC